MELPMKSMRELMDEAIHELDLKDPHLKIAEDFPNLASFITQDVPAQNFIKKLLTDDDYNLPDSTSTHFYVSKTRARHASSTFLMGLLFTKFAGLFEDFPTVLNIDTPRPDISQKMWKITSLYHDKAYYSEHLNNPQLDLQKTYKPFLLTDEYAQDKYKCLANFSGSYPKAMAHSYTQLLDYNNYIRENNHRWGDGSEQNDHGILGGLDTFARLAGSAAPIGILSSLHYTPFITEIDLPLIKASCMAIAQHNIFKSGNSETDERYTNYHLTHLLHTSDFRIKADTPLLLFLCLVDTIECLKRFSQGATKGKYLESLTILDKTRLYVDRDRIVLDFTELKNHIISKKDAALTERYGFYLNGLTGFSKWTDLHGTADPDNPDIITITLSK